MGKLSPHTLNCYKSKLRRLRKTLPFIPESDEVERTRTIAQIEKLTNQLGLEMNDLEIQLARGPGRPRSQPDIAKYEPKEAVEEAKPEINELEIIRQRVIANNPELAQEYERRKELRESEDRLKNMIDQANDELVSHGGDADERPKSETDNARAVATNRE